MRGDHDHGFDRRLDSDAVHAQRQLKMLESGETHTGDKIPDSTPRDTAVRVRRCIDELNSLLKEFAIAPPRP
jgi:hypothetical protein